MIFKRVGFYKEMEHGKETDDSILEHINKESDDFVSNICNYLESGVVFIVSPGTVTDVINEDNGAIATPSIYTDGKWVWPEDLSYYVKNYKLRIPKEFVDDMVNNNWEVNISIDDVDFDDIKIEDF